MDILPTTLEEILHQAGFSQIAGVDEAGRGACAGPLVAASVILPHGLVLPELNDSKALTHKQRDRLYDVICAEATAVSVVEISSSQCDELGIQTANIQALRRAVLRLQPSPDYVLSDGFAVDGLGPGLGVIKGDQVAACVSAASVVAKVTRDRIMVSCDQEYPGYDFAHHKGYVTALHQRRLVELGPSPIHRLKYANVKRAIKKRDT